MKSSSPPPEPEDVGYCARSDAWTLDLFWLKVTTQPFRDLQPFEELEYIEFFPFGRTICF